MGDGIAALEDAVGCKSGRDDDKMGSCKGVAVDMDSEISATAGAGFEAFQGVHDRFRVDTSDTGVADKR